MTIRLHARPPGGLGNRLFTYNFIRQVSYASGIPYAHPWLGDNRHFESMGLCLRAGWPGRGRVIDSTFLKSVSPGEFYDLLRGAGGDQIILKPPFLGDTFFDYSLVAPSNFIRLRARFVSNPGWRRDHRLVVGVHFRGGDFFRWNPRAVLGTDYYLKAIRMALADAGERKVAIALFADDKSLDSYRAVRSEFAGLCIDPSAAGQTGPAEISDFHGLSVCDYIVSSPSTFCIWAGILGGGVKIVHSEDWMNSQARENDRFWQQLLAGGGRYYRVWAAA